MKNVGVATPYFCKIGFLIFIFHCLVSCSNATQQAQINQAQINTSLGLYYLHNGDSILAKEKLLQALKANPKDPDANDAMGYFLEKIDETQSAEQYYKNAIKYAEDKGIYQNNYGAYLYREKQYNAALTQFLLATQDPNYLFLGHAYKNAGLAALKLKDSEKAKFYFSKAKISNLK